MEKLVFVHLSDIHFTRASGTTHDLDANVRNELCLDAVKVSKQTLSRELRAMGYRRLSARPRHHAQAEGAISAFKKVSPRVWTRSGARRVLAQAA